MVSNSTLVLTKHITRNQLLLPLVNVANACLEYKVPSLVIVSSGGVSKPDSPVYKFLNIFGKIMEEKIKGEDTVRNLYKDMDTSTCTYTIIRPGG